MLLRQLSLAHYEQGRFTRAREVAEQAIDVGVLRDVLGQDAARAALAEGELDRAVTHLRLAARRCPASRRPFHLWTLGSVLFLAQRYAEAIAALERSVHWSTLDRPLYKAHLALARIAAGEPVRDLQATIEGLAGAPCGQGYGRFVLGHLAYAAGEKAVARRVLEAFVRRVESGGAVQAMALAGELAMARSTLSKLRSS